MSALIPGTRPKLPEVALASPHPCTGQAHDQGWPGDSGGWGLITTLLRDRTRLSTGSWSNTCSSSIRWTQGPRLTALSSQPSPVGGWGRTGVKKRARGSPRPGHTGLRPVPSGQGRAPGPTCADEQHCTGGSIEPRDPVGHQLGEVGVFLHQQGPAPPRPHLLLHQRVLLDEVEGVVGQLQGTGVAVAPVPVVDALGAGERREPSARREGHWRGGHKRAPAPDDSPSRAAGWVPGRCSGPTSGLAHGTPCRAPRTPSGPLPTCTHRLLTGPCRPCHSKGGTPRVRPGATTAPGKQREGRAQAQEGHGPT